MADAAPVSSNRPNQKKYQKIITSHPPQSVERKSTKECLALSEVAGGAAPKLGRSTGEDMLPNNVVQIPSLDKVVEIAKETGSGAFGKTYKAVFKADSTIVCIKTIPKAVFAQAKNDQFDAEIFQWAPRRNSEVSLEIRHPNVGNISKAFHDNDSLHLMLPECSGGDLFDILAAGKLDGPRGDKYFAQMITGLGYIHGKNIAHRDIRPENYMLSTSQKTADLVLVDFALAKKAEDGTKMTTIVGHPNYVAPEVLSGSYDKKCDCYSIGVVGFIACTGRYPVAEADPKAQLAKVKAGELELSGLDNVLGQTPGVLKNLLNKDPAARPSSTELASQEWIAQMGKSGGGCCAVL